MSSARANRRGMLALMGAMAAFAVNDMMLKLIAQRYPLGEVITVRGTDRDAAGRRLRGRAGPRLGAARGSSASSCSPAPRCDGMAMVLFTTALVHMPLAELSAINLVSPLLITAAAVIFFARGGRLAALGGDQRSASSARLIIVKPTPSAFNAWALLGVATARSSAWRAT